MQHINFVRPTVPLAYTWSAVRFREPLMGWAEFASFLALHSPGPHPTANALRLAFWEGKIRVRAVRFGQKVVLDGRSVKAWIKRGGYRESLWRRAGKSL